MPIFQLFMENGLQHTKALIEIDSIWSDIKDLNLDMVEIIDHLHYQGGAAKEALQNLAIEFKAHYAHSQTLPENGYLYKKYMVYVTAMKITYIHEHLQLFLTPELIVTLEVLKETADLCFNDINDCVEKKELYFDKLVAISDKSDLMREVDLLLKENPFNIQK